MSKTPIQIIRAKYGPNKKTKQAINAAVRAEVPSSRYVFDAINTLNLIISDTRPDNPELSARLLGVVRHLEQTLDVMREQVIDRYTPPE